MMPFRRPIATALFAALVAGTPAAGAFADAGLDWRPIPVADSKVRLTLPDAAEGARYFRAQTDNYAATLYIAQVPTNAYRPDQIFFLYVELSPGRFFRAGHDIADILRWKELQAGGLHEGERFSVVAGGGRYDVATFTVEGDVACAAVGRTWGSHGSMTTGAGSRRITGYGCENRGKPLTRERIKEALDGLEILD